MKVKYVVHKKTKAFLCFDEFDGRSCLFTSELPQMPLNPDADDKDLMNYFNYHYPELSFDEYEIVEFDLIESGIVGADIRNKLTPANNLISMLETYFTTTDEDGKSTLLKFIKLEIENIETSIEYLKNLL